jgi:hypothetical protein
VVARKRSRISQAARAGSHVEQRIALLRSRQKTSPLHFKHGGICSMVLSMVTRRSPWNHEAAKAHRSRPKAVGHGKLMATRPK